MNTSDLLDLFQLGGDQRQPAHAGERSQKKGGAGKQEGLKSILENLPELWDEDQYRAEYDLSSFMQSLGSAQAQ